MLARRRVRGQQPQDEWLTAVSRKGPPVAQMQRGVPQALLAHADESELLQAHLLPVQQAWRSVARLLVEEPALCVPLEQWLRALRARSALPLALQPEPQARSVSLRLALRSLVEPAPLAQQASTVQPSPPLPLLLCPLWQPPPPALLLRRRPESFCAPFPRRPQGSSSSASSFP